MRHTPRLSLTVSALARRVRRRGRMQQRRGDSGEGPLRDRDLRARHHVGRGEPGLRPAGVGPVRRRGHDPRHRLGGELVRGEAARRDIHRVPSGQRREGHQPVREPAHLRRGATAVRHVLDRSRHRHVRGHDRLRHGHGHDHRQAAAAGGKLRHQYQRAACRGQRARGHHHDRPGAHPPRTAA